MNYDGRALVTVTVDGRTAEPVGHPHRAEPVSIAVRLRLRGRWEPVDGRFHWGGRIAPEPRIAQLVRAGRRDVRVAVDDRRTTARLGEVDPWGGIRITGVGVPPWPVEAIAEAVD